MNWMSRGPSIVIYVSSLALFEYLSSDSILKLKTDNIYGEW